MERKRFVTECDGCSQIMREGDPYVSTHITGRLCATCAGIEAKKRDFIERAAIALGAGLPDCSAHNAVRGAMRLWDEIERQLSKEPEKQTAGGVSLTEQRAARERINPELRCEDDTE